MSDGLHSVRITGFGSLADVKMIPLMRTASLQRFVAEAGGAASLLHYGPKRTPALGVELEFVQGQHRDRYGARLGFAAGDKLMYLDEFVEHQQSGQPALHRETLGSGHWESLLRDAKFQSETTKRVNDWMSQLTFFHFHDTSMTSALRTHARAEDDQSLRSDGSNLAAFLGRLERSTLEAEQKAWFRINQLTRRIAPSVKQLCPTNAHNGVSAVRLDWIDDQDQRFGCHQLSDGTLRAIALITALAQPTESLPRFISIDEPELGLHPAAIRLLAELARSVSRHTQIMFATQSTDFLDHFEPEEVVVTERDAGRTSLRRLDAEDLAGWLEDSKSLHGPEATSTTGLPQPRSACPHFDA